MLEDRAVPASFFVTNLGDSGFGNPDLSDPTGRSGDLRYCIEQANGNGEDDTITFTTAGTVSLNGTLFIQSEVPSALTITGLGSGSTTVTRNAAAGDFRIFDIFGNSPVTLKDLTISGGRAGSGNGGAIQVTFGTLNISGLVFSDNQAAQGGALSVNGTTVFIDQSTFVNNSATNGPGGAIDSPGLVMTITRSTFSGNHSTSRGGAIAIGSNDTVNISNSTFSGNRSDSNGGGAIDSRFGAKFTITNSTFTLNISAGPGSGGGAIFNTSSMTLTNCIVAGNDAPVGPDIFGTINSGGNNLIQTQTGYSITGTQTGNIYNQNPLLAGLANNGGPTLTHALLPGSPAIDAGATIPEVSIDQRGVARPQGGGSDIGAFESVPVPANENPVLVLDGLGDGLTNVGVRHDRAFQVFDPNGDPLLITIDFGDGTAAQFVTASGAFLFSHTYFADASFFVNIRAEDGRGGIDLETFRVDVLLSGVDVKLRASTVMPGQTSTISVPLVGFEGDLVFGPDGQPLPGVTATFTRDPNSTGQAALIVASVPAEVALNLGGVVSEGNLITSYDVRIVGGGIGDRATVTFRYLNDNFDVPTITYFDKLTQTQRPILASQVIIDPANRTITLVFDANSTPGIQALGGTVFTISVPGTVSGTNNSVMAAALIGTNVQATGTAPSAAISSQANAAVSPGSPAPAESQGTPSGSSSNEGESSGEGPLQDLPPPPSALMVLPTVTIKPSTIEPPDRPAERPTPEKGDTSDEEGAEPDASSQEVSAEALDELFADPAGWDGAEEAGDSWLGLVAAAVAGGRMLNDRRGGRVKREP